MNVLLIHMHTHKHTYFISCAVITSLILGGINAIFQGEKLLLIHVFHKFVSCIVNGHCFKCMHAYLSVSLRFAFFVFFYLMHTHFHLSIGVHILY